MVMGMAQENGISQPSDTVHYNPSDLSAWVQSMLSKLNTGDEALQTFLNLSSPYLLLCYHTSVRYAMENPHSYIYKQLHSTVAASSIRTPPLEAKTKGNSNCEELQQ
ncbi:hypothetical protein TB2_023899 [Malus domestica]